MKNSKRIAGVSVNTEVPPTREELVNSALQSKDFYRLPQDEAIVKINKEIDKSGLYKNNVTKEPATDELRGELPKADTKVNKPKPNRKNRR